MDPLQIRVALMKNAESMSSVARKIGDHRQNIHQVIHGQRTTERIRMALADATGLRIDELFDDDLAIRQERIRQGNLARKAEGIMIPPANLSVSA